MLEPLSPMTNSSLLSFAELFSFMMAERDTETRNNNGHVQSHRQIEGQQQQPVVGAAAAVGLMPPQRSPPNIPPLSFSDVMAVLSRAVREIRAGTLQLAKVAVGERDLTYYHRTLGIIVHLIFLLAKIQPQLSSLQDHALRKSLYDLVRLNARSRNGYTLLHLACTRDSTTLSRYPICSFPSTDVIRLLLDVGADPESIDHVSWLLMTVFSSGRKYGAAHSGSDSAVSSFSCQLSTSTRMPSGSSQFAGPQLCPNFAACSTHPRSCQSTEIHNAQVSVRSSHPPTSVAFQRVGAADATAICSQTLIGFSRKAYGVKYSLLRFLLLVQSKHKKNSQDPRPSSHMFRLAFGFFLFFADGPVSTKCLCPPILLPVHFPSRRARLTHLRYQRFSGFCFCYYPL